MSNHPCPSLHLYKNLFWGAENSHVQDEPKPHLQAHIAAAHRDARVSVLLDAYFDNQDLNNPRSDLRTVEYLTSMAQAYELVLQAQQHNLIASAKILWPHPRHTLQGVHLAYRNYSLSLQDRMIVKRVTGTIV